MLQRTVQYPLSETCSYVSKRPAGISYLSTLVIYTTPNISSFTKLV